jgi:hypothetical protein
MNNQIVLILFASILNRFLRMTTHKELRYRSLNDELKSLWFTFIGIAVIWVPINLIWNYFTK